MPYYSQSSILIINLKNIELSNYLQGKDRNLLVLFSKVAKKSSVMLWQLLSNWMFLSLCVKPHDRLSSLPNRQEK
jgi:hypothetical protein